ncbi:hypothetical protein GQ55_6G284400 [Panicum hallii var. hallii]|uniref:Uncharacterized protein n=2 Tax=Panicum hallii TaxID=206008 RepID=A0A2T7DAM4_9POAL|nr:hypothetical protein GQ55_6G284400 [Panicum hallii var. hallii]PVH37365.1 hypothetical protein PAHAL_6G297300 [Panicum hallii]
MASCSGHMLEWVAIVNIDYGPGQISNASPALGLIRSSSCFASGCSRAGPTRPQVISGSARQVDLWSSTRERHSHRQ